jgi:4-diphosphocytidyl-2-C-methyl-D-erythritol kinase
MIVFPNCKINLGLHILQKRDDGFHDLETVFYPLPLQDALEVINNDIKEPDLNFSASGLPIDGDNTNNLCYKAYYLVKQLFPQLPAVSMHLHKVIPMGAGLGGGSADGAFTLMALNKKFNLGLCESALIDLSLKLGSDAPFFIVNKPSYATGRGERLTPVELDLSAYKILIINPNIHINTGWAFSQIKPFAERASLKELIQSPINEWKEKLVNDFELPVSTLHPEIGAIKEALYQHHALYAAMSGSGSTVFGIFPKEINLSDLHFPGRYFVKEV